MNTSTVFRLATPTDIDAIWQILQQAIERRRLDGSQQWQDGYPNTVVVASDISNRFGYVLLEKGEVAAYAAVMVNNEPAYTQIEGAWLTDGSDFLVVHRVAVEKSYLGMGLAKKIFEKIEKMALERSIRSIRVDTNFDNPAMLHLLSKLKYHYCGEVLLRDNKRKAFEKLLTTEK